MDFNERVTHLEPEGAYAVLSRALQLERQGREILHLELGQPDFRTPEHVAQAGIAAIEEGLTRYTPPAGLMRFRELIAEDAGRRRGVAITPDMVVVGPGSKPGIFFPTLALVSPGDEVIYPDPGFPTYHAMIRVAGGTPVPVMLREENQFSFDLDVFDSRISNKTKLIILNSPAKPTGGVITLTDLRHIAAQAQKYNVWILADEIYSRLVYDGMESGHRQPADRPHVQVVTLAVAGAVRDKDGVDDSQLARTVVRSEDAVLVVFEVTPPDGQASAAFKPNTRAVPVAHSRTRESEILDLYACSTDDEDGLSFRALTTREQACRRAFRANDQVILRPDGEISLVLAGIDQHEVAVEPDFRRFMQRLDVACWANRYLSSGSRRVPSRSYDVGHRLAGERR